MSTDASWQDAPSPRLAAHRWPWMEALSSGLGHVPFWLEAVTDDGPVGGLPLMLVRGPLFGKFLVSLPYLNTGGLWCRDKTAGNLLVDAACRLADELDVKHLELRHEIPFAHDRFNFERTDKVHMRLALPSDCEALMKSFKSKVRSQIKKSLTETFDVTFGGAELLDPFYDVFAQNMRDLGTPVFSKRLFSAILNSFQGDAELCVLHHDGIAAAGALLVHGNGTTEVPSASCRQQFNRKNANMRMYWHLLERAIQRSSGTFDFGRSSEGGGTFKFKQQWGAKPDPATWQYYVRHGDPASLRPDADGKQRLVSAWKRLPVWLTKIIGPSIVRGIP
ncbi:FemAB family XrtA/PEP-CTERM system-associated protein [Rubripirellula lacrimiformis]